MEGKPLDYNPMTSHPRGSHYIILCLSAFVNRRCHKCWLTIYKDRWGGVGWDLNWLTITMTALLLHCVRHTLMTHSFLRICSDTYYTIDVTRCSRLSLTIGLSCLTALAETNKFSQFIFPALHQTIQTPKTRWLSLLETMPRLMGPEGVVHLEGLEPSVYGLEVRCFIH